MRENPYWALAAVFVPLSLVSVGGGPSIFAGIQHEAVEVHRWLSAREFVDLFAIARAAPGPGSMLATLIGWKLAGWPGAIVATLALFVPSSLLCYWAARAWNRHRGKPWHTAVENGLTPIATGLILAGAIAVSRTAQSGVAAWVIALAATACLVVRPRLDPLLLLAVGGIAFMVWGAFAG